MLLRLVDRVPIEHPNRPNLADVEITHAGPHPHSGPGRSLRALARSGTTRPGRPG